jgi:hypothetical protein
MKGSAVRVRASAFSDLQGEGPGLGFGAGSKFWNTCLQKRVPMPPLHGAGVRTVSAIEACRMSTELLDTDGSVLLDDEHAATLRDRLDHVARQTENGREGGGVFLDELRVGLA